MQVECQQKEKHQQVHIPLIYRKNKELHQRWKQLMQQGGI